MSEQLKTGYAYLVKRTDGIGNVSKVTCLEITNTCYKIQFEKSDSYYIEKSKFNFDYKIIESLNLSIQEYGYYL